MFEIDFLYKKYKYFDNTSIYCNQEVYANKTRPMKRFIKKSDVQNKETMNEIYSIKLNS